MVLSMSLLQPKKWCMGTSINSASGPGPFLVVDWLHSALWELYDAGLFMYISTGRTIEMGRNYIT